MLVCYNYLMQFLKLANRAIEYLFYALFFLVPLVFAGNTSELFEFNKMWLTFAIAAGIGFFWISKMVILRDFRIRRTPLDIPILLFLVAMIVSTIFSWDQHISFFGYYSRFNGGLLSMLTYVFLFYAFVSNLEENGPRFVKRAVLSSLLSGLVVALWALPSHFGYDPTCLIFRGHLDVSCWTADFQPRVRIFGPLGQPDWLAGYMGVLLPISFVFALEELKKTKNLLNKKVLFHSALFFMFLSSLIYTGSRSGIAASFIALALLAFFYFFKQKDNLALLKTKGLGVLAVILIALVFLIGIPLPGINKVSFNELRKTITKEKVAEVNQDVPSGVELGGSNSFQIRLIVWEGAIKAWMANPIIGTGVETFAFAYYKYRPAEHNLVSEWNFLYNKAHNEYLNYLTTTGLFGFLTHSSFIGLFLLLVAKNIFSIKTKYLGFLKAPGKIDTRDPLVLALTASFASILMINFFGFSVVILNIYLFLIPAFVLSYWAYNSRKEVELKKDISLIQWLGVSLAGIVLFGALLFLARSWIADTKYALGYNYDRAGEYQSAYQLLQGATNLRSEPVFRDELALNNAILASAYASQGATEGAKLAQDLANNSLQISQSLVDKYPRNIVFWKNRVRILYSLSRIDPAYLPKTLEAMKKTTELAPTDASIVYNLGVIYGQSGDLKKGVEVLKQTVELKPDYKEARYALALFLHELSVDTSGKIIEKSNHDRAVSELRYILKNLDSKDPQAKESLSAWEKER